MIQTHQRFMIQSRQPKHDVSMRADEAAYELRPACGL